MAPIKAVLRSKLDKADTAKSLMELVDKYELLSDPSSPSSCDEDQASDSEVDMCGLSPSQQTMHHQDDERQPIALPTLFLKPPAASVSAAELAECDSSLAMQRLELQLLSQYLYEHLQQRAQQNQVTAHSHLPEPTDEQPLNLSCTKPLKRPAPVEENEVSREGVPETKRPCLIGANPSATFSTGGQQRRRKRSYRLSDNDEIRAYQGSAPELFAWDGHKPMIHQFLLKLLNNASCTSLIRWLDRSSGLFKVLQPGSVARLWQFIKGNRTDNYECFARGIRHSRDIGKYFEAHDFRKKKVYKFSEKALRPQSAADKELNEQQQQQQVPQKHAPHQQQQQQPQFPRQLDAEQLSSSCNRSSTDVLAKLKSALVERQQLQAQQQQPHQPKPEPTKLKEEPEEVDDDSSSLVIADCDY